MNPFQEAAKKSRESHKELEAKIEQLAQQYRPKVERKYVDTDTRIMVTVYQAAWADGAASYNRVR
jgi:hypothetical protein